MKDIIQGRIHPYLFHMNWNSGREAKRQFYEQIGKWYINDTCTEKLSTDALMRDVEMYPMPTRACCIVEPKAICHFRDKPSINQVHSLRKRRHFGEI
jgi:hypothetical protein